MAVKRPSADESFMPSTFDTIDLRVGAPVARLTLNRPERLNAINKQMLGELQAALDAVEADDTARVLVVTGAGGNFSSGFDLKEQMEARPSGTKAWREILDRDFSAVTRFWSLKKPTIAAVNGYCLAGGCELALCCDFIYAAETARFALTEVTLGIMPGAGGTQNLPRAVGERRAKEIILTGRPFSAAEACEWGMVNRLVAPGEVVEEALATARRIADNAPISVRQAKHAIHYGLQMDLASGLMLEIEAYNRMVPTADRREGIAAFNEKRKPLFTGR